MIIILIVIIMIIMHSPPSPPAPPSTPNEAVLTLLPDTRLTNRLNSWSSRSISELRFWISEGLTQAES